MVGCTFWRLDKDIEVVKKISAEAAYELIKFVNSLGSQTGLDALNANELTCCGIKLMVADNNADKVEEYIRVAA